MCADFFLVQRTDYPSSFFAELYQNSTCLPPEIYPYDSTCTLGAFPAVSDAFFFFCLGFLPLFSCLALYPHATQKRNSPLP